MPTWWANCALDAAALVRGGGVDRSDEWDISDRSGLPNRGRGLALLHRGDVCFAGVLAQ